MRSLAVLAAVGLAGLTLAACGGSSSSATSTSTKQQDCTAVANVLSDGPDPDADSIGYAEAQVLPLQQLKLTDPTIRTAVQQLDAAYKAFSSSNGGTGTAIKVSSAERAINHLCPNAAP